VLCDGGRKQAGASGIRVQWGRRADKSKFACNWKGIHVISQNDFAIREMYCARLVFNFRVNSG
jgi:hypothetical protein